MPYYGPSSGGGGSAIAAAAAQGDAAGDININSGTFVDFPGMVVSLPAAVGDKLTAEFVGQQISASGFLAITFRYGTTDHFGTTPVQIVSATNNSLPFIAADVYTVQEGDLVDGEITVKVRAKHASAAQDVRNSAFGVPLLKVTNYGH